MIRLSILLLIIVLITAAGVHIPLGVLELLLEALL